MRYSELKIETQRQAPARARSEGAAMLKRAGYVRPEGELSALGRRTAARLEELAETKTPAQFFASIELPVLLNETGAAFFPIESGREEVAHCAACGYTELRELARFRKEEPEPEEPRTLERVATPEANTIEALARYLNLPKAKTAKALMYTRTTDQKFVFVVVRGDMQLSETKLRAQIGEFRAATPEEIIAAGATPGYASPIGLRGVLIAVDDLVPRSPNLVAGANEAGYHLLNTNYERDYEAEIVADLVLAEAGAACPNCGEPLSMESAERLSDAKGYCLTNILEALAEIHHDEKGLQLPMGGAPFAVYLMNVPGKELDTRGKAAALHVDWENDGVPVLLDDRDERAGVKFADADLIGLPVRATVGERGMKDGMVELKDRRRGEMQSVPFSEALALIRSWTKQPS